MAKGITKAASVIDNTGGATTAISFGTLPTVGAPIIVCVEQYRGASLTPVLASIVDNQATHHTYQKLVLAQSGDGVNRHQVSIYVLPRVEVSSGTFTITVNKTDTNTNVQVAELTGFTDRPYLLAVGYNTGTTTWAATASGQHQTLDGLAVGAAACSVTDNQAWSNSSGFTNIGNSPDGTTSEVSSSDYLAISAPGTASLTYSRNAATMSGWASALVVLGDFVAASNTAGNNWRRPTRDGTRRNFDLKGWLNTRAHAPGWFWRGWKPVSGGATYTLVAVTGSFSLTGNATGLIVSRKLAAAVGTFTLAGNAANLKAARVIVAGIGTFSLVGNAANLIASRKLPVSVGTFALTGNAAGLTYTPSGTTYTLAVSTGAFALTGNEAALSYTPATPTSPVFGGGGFGVNGHRRTAAEKKRIADDIRRDIEQAIAGIEAAAAPIVARETSAPPVAVRLPSAPDFAPYFEQLTVLTAQLEAVNARQAAIARARVAEAREMVEKIAALSLIAAAKQRRRRNITIAAQYFFGD